LLKERKETLDNLRRISRHKRLNFTTEKPRPVSSKVKAKLLGSPYKLV
jgi:hypothetical protein